MALSESEARQINERFDEMGAKITALQFMVCQNLAAQYLMVGIDQNAMNENHDALRELFQKLTFKRLNPAESDAWADSIQQALDALLAQIEKSFQNRAGL